MTSVIAQEIAVRSESDSEQWCRMTTERTQDASLQSRDGLRRGHLHAGHIAFFVIAAVAPLAGLAGAGPVVFASNGAAAPATFLLAAALFAVFSVGYVAMSRHTTNAGGFVAYIARGLGARVATAMAYVTIVAYFAIQIGMWAQFGVFMQNLALTRLHLDLPSALWTLASLSLATLIVARGVDLSIRVAGTLLALEVGCLLLFDVLVGAHGGAVHALSPTFAPAAVFGPGLGVAFLFSVNVFFGFEATVVFSEEARDPRRSVPRAIVIAICVIATLYAVSAFAVSVAVGTDTVQAAAATDPAGFMIQAMSGQVGGWFGDVVEILIVSSYLASLLSFHNMFARLLFSLGRAGVLPRYLGVISGSQGVPRRAAVTLAVVVGSLFVAFTVAGADPILVTFTWLLALATVGLLLMLATVSIAIVVFFWRSPCGENAIATRVFPSLACVGFLTVVLLSIDNYGTLLGGQGGAARLLLILLPVAALAGVWVANKTSIRPDFTADLT
ncbi:MAG: APC family permease [Nocardioides sp.]|uniref:APC family permease n=1 Tax=Nocardioides sp. TaxID=35761 RepID=UPI0039E3A3A7